MFHPLSRDAPLMVTVTRTRGAHPHTDVTLWFLLDLPADAPVQADPGEFAGTRWVPVGGHDLVPGSTCEPHLHRLEARLLALTG